MIMADKMLKIGITHGDTNGISYEVITKALLDTRLFELCTILVYGSSKVASYHRKLMKGCGDFKFNMIKQVANAAQQKANMINIPTEEIKVELGQSTAIAGKASLEALHLAKEDILKGDIDAIVTAPINKNSVRLHNADFIGHTEFFAQMCKTKDVLMLMVHDNLRIGTVTTHCALSEVPKNLTKELIKSKLKVLKTSLCQDFLVTIAVLSLNPHAGENGAFGKEEINVIIPAIEECFNEGIYAFGPYPADGFFASSDYQKYDAVLTMYHDQAMIPFKLLSCGEGVNFTAGLPIVRTSPAHGTAYDIVGKDRASEESLRQAIYLACDICRNRKRYIEQD